jgi:hypothetical protein
LGRPVWVDDVEFDIRRHLRRTRLPPPGTDDALKSVAPRHSAASRTHGNELSWRCADVTRTPGRRSICRIGGWPRSFSSTMWAG